MMTEVSCFSSVSHVVTEWPCLTLMLCETVYLQQEDSVARL